MAPRAVEVATNVGGSHLDPTWDSDALVEPEVAVGLIADGVHVDPDLLQLVVRAKGPRRVALTTDQTAAAGAPPGRYRLAGLEVESRGGAVRRDGVLAGSAATMDGMLRVLTSAGVPLVDAVTMAAVTPRRLVGRRPAADLVLLDPDLRVRLTLVAGEAAYAS